MSIYANPTDGRAVTARPARDRSGDEVGYGLSMFTEVQMRKFRGRMVGHDVDRIRALVAASRERLNAPAAASAR